MRRRRIATGIYRDAYGYEVRAHWRGRVVTRRFPPDTGSRVMREWRAATLDALEGADPLAPPWSFREAARTYVRGPACLRLASAADRTRTVQDWVEVFGDTPVALIDAAEAQAHLDAWMAEGYAASTLNHAIDALVAVVPRLAGQLRRERPPDQVLVPPPRARITAVLRSLRPSQTATRLWWLYWTGMRPSQLTRLRPGDVDWDARRVTVPAGKAGRAYVVPLPAEAMAQLRPLTTAETFASLSRGSANRTLKRACDRLRVPRFSLYALRRSFGSTLRAHGTDLADVAQLMGHRRIATAARYAPVVATKLERAMEALGVVAARGSGPGPPPLGD